MLLLLLILLNVWLGASIGDGGDDGGDDGGRKRGLGQASIRLSLGWTRLISSSLTLPSGYKIPRG